MSRLLLTFDHLKLAGKKALIPFVTAGFPDAGITVPLMHAMVTAGVDVIELGVPFSDPMADGPTIQRASEQALRHGVSLTRVLQMVAEFRREDRDTPVVLMGYANPIEAMGQARFVREAADAGVDGVLTVDYPPEACVEFAKHLKAANIDPIFLLAPTSTDERIRQLANVASGYVYYVSLTGVTGAGHLDVDAVAARLPQIRAATGLPVGVGFGIRDAETAGRIASFADAIVVGSRIIEELERTPAATAIERVVALLEMLRQGIDSAHKV